MFKLCCATRKGAATRGGSLDVARPIDARAAAANDAVDAAVEDLGRASEAASRDVTPPPTLADQLAELAANGEITPGVANDELLVTPVDGDDEALNIEASAHATAREQTRGQRTKKNAKLVTNPERSRGSKTKRKVSASDTDSDTEVQPKKRSKPKQPVVTVDSDSDDDDAHTNQSRHKSVKSSDLYKNWEVRVPGLRRRYQVLMLVRDGFPFKVGNIARNSTTGWCFRRPRTQWMLQSVQCLKHSRPRWKPPSSPPTTSNTSFRFFPLLCALSDSSALRACSAVPFTTGPSLSPWRLTLLQRPSTSRPRTSRGCSTPRSLYPTAPSSSIAVS